MRKTMLGLAAVLVAMLSLIMAPSAMASPPFQDYTVYAQPGETVTYDFSVQAPGVTINQILGTGSCTFDGPWKVKYTVPLSAQVGSPDTVCNIGVIYNGGIQGTALFVIKVGSPPPPPDTTAPVVTITSPADGTTFTVNTATLTYGVTDNSGNTPSCNIPNNYGVPLNVGSNTITVNCTDAAGNTGSDSVTVTYTPPPVGSPVKVKLENVTIREGDVNKIAVIPVTLSKASNAPITLTYKTQAKTATSGVDYVAVTNGSVTIPAGATSGEILITIIGDNIRESSENFFVIGDIAIESDAYATLTKDKATVVIENDDSGCR